MATPTHLTQDCTVDVSTAGVTTFTIASYLDNVKADDLPHPDVFVYRITDPAGPKSDTFRRIANVVELSSIIRGRDNALAAGATEYLSYTCTVSYTDVNSATGAKLAIQQRLDTLIADWIQYTTKYLTPTGFDLPAVESPLLTANKEVYKTALTKKDAADAALTAANATLSTSETAVTTATSDLATKTADAQMFAQLQTLLSTAMGGETTYRTQTDGFITQAEIFYNAAQALGSVDPTYVSAAGLFASYLGIQKDAAVAEKFAGSANLNQLQMVLNTASSGKQAAVVAATATKASADATYASAKTAVVVATNTAQAAANEVDAALAAVVALCPDFNPATDL